jgi:hypothetical protein
MRKVLLTTTALVAMAGVNVANADVSISGLLEQRYNQWSDDDAAASGQNNSSMNRDMQLWFKSSATLDNGMTVGANIRMREATAGGDRNYISLGGDFGSVVFGTTWAPVYSMSVGTNWVEDVASGEYTGGSVGTTATSDDGATRGRLIESTYQTTSAKAQKLVYTTPSISGFTAGVSFADAGQTSEADHTSMAVKYSTAVGAGNMTIMYGQETADHANATSTTADNKVTQYGIEYSADFGRIWAVAMGSTTETNAGSETSDLKGNQFGISYAMSDSANLIYYHTSSEQNAAASDNVNDEFSSNAFGVKYNVGGGLSLGLLHTVFDYTDATNSTATTGAGSNDGSATRVEMAISF